MEDGHCTSPSNLKARKPAQNFWQSICRSWNPRAGSLALSEWEVKCWHFLRLNLPCICSKKREGDASSNTRPTDWWLEKSSKQIIVDSKCRCFFLQESNLWSKCWTHVRITFGVLWSAVLTISTARSLSCRACWYLGSWRWNDSPWDVTRGLWPGYLIWKVKDSIMISWLAIVVTTDVIHTYVSIEYAESIWFVCFLELGVSENSIPLNPMVNDHYPY